MKITFNDEVFLHYRFLSKSEAKTGCLSIEFDPQFEDELDELLDLEGRSGTLSVFIGSRGRRKIWSSHVVFDNKLSLVILDEDNPGLAELRFYYD